MILLFPSFQMRLSLCTLEIKLGEVHKRVDGQGGKDHMSILPQKWISLAFCFFFFSFY